MRIGLAVDRGDQVGVLLEDHGAPQLEGLTEFEKPKRIAFLPRELTMDHGELTPTLKLRRTVILEKHADLVAAIYGQTETHS